MGDDHGWEETGYCKTPVLDEMAKNGLVLDRFYPAHPEKDSPQGARAHHGSYMASQDSFPVFPLSDSCVF